MKLIEFIVEKNKEKKTIWSTIAVVLLLGVLAVTCLMDEEKTTQGAEEPYQKIQSQLMKEIYTEKDSKKVQELLASLPESYDEAVQRDDLLLESAKNTDDIDYYLWDMFYDHVKKETPTSMIKALFTTEGDMLYIYISYDGEKFYYMSDNSRDKFRGDGPKYYEKTYSRLVVEERMINGKLFQDAILTNDEKLTCEEYDNYWVSSLAQPMPDASSLIFREME